MAGTYELKRSDDQFMFNLRADGNNEIILTSERYGAKAGAEDGIAAVRTNAPIDARFERKSASDGKPYFVLKAANHEQIGRSEPYSSSAAMEDGIAAVKTNGPAATVKDLT